MALDRIPPKRLLDAGCGCGNLIETIGEQCDPRCCEREWECCGCGNLIEIRRGMMSRYQCYGIDISDGNVEAAKGRRLENIYLGDGEKIAEILPVEVTFDLILFCGLLNRQVLPSKEKALTVLRNALGRLAAGVYVIITGFTSCHLTAEDLAREGIEVLRMSLPANLFRNYDEYFLRQLYLGRKS